MKKQAVTKTGNQKPPHMTTGRFLSSFGRRIGKRLGLEQKNLLREVLPLLSITLPVDGLIDIHGFFRAQPKQIWMEIGFGGGEFLTGQVQANPEVGFIGCEPYLNGVANLLKQLPEDNRNQVRIWADDARDLLMCCPDGVLHKVFILFPDPWPKSRHHKRRIVSDRMLDLLHKKLASGGELILATDHVDYAKWMQEHIGRHQGFTWRDGVENDLNLAPEGWVPTRYEAKTRAMGRDPVFFKLKKQYFEDSFK